MPSLNAALKFLANDWAITRRRFKAAVKFANNYSHFKQRGFTHKAAVFNARNAVN